MKTSMKLIFHLTFAAVSLMFIQSASPQNKSDFSRNGKIHQEVIDSWNNYYRDYFASQIQKRLFENGDVYVLYDVQIGGLQSFVEMTRRCKDTKQIGELVDLLNPVFSTLKPIAGAGDNNTGWICEGGNICTSYGFIGKEVPLCSVQFLGLLGALATNITENIPPQQQTEAQRAFIINSFNTMAIQLNRWLTVDYLASVTNRLPMRSADLKNGSSRNFFTDKDLWNLTVISDLSELQQWGVQTSNPEGKKAFNGLLSKKENIQKIFDLFLARTTLIKAGKGMRADLDKGFWKYYYDNRYARYSGSESPVSWTKDSKGEWQMNTRIKWDSTYISNDIGWDISHSRRLVPALETFARNRENIKKVWGYNNPAFDPISLRQAFANQIVEKIWNGDMKYPQFSNFWSGDNGWYRVAYAHQTGRRFEGNHPYGLNTSMPKGGYPLWGAFNPTLSAIFRNIFELSLSDDPAAKSFINENYKGLLINTDTKTSKKTVQSLSFLSDMVELPSDHLKK